MEKQIFDKIYNRFLFCILLIVIFTFFKIVFTIGYGYIENRRILRYGIEHPSVYLITSIDGLTDTIKVWNDGKTEYFQIKKACDFKNFNVNYIEYTPYNCKYKDLPTDKDIKQIYNIVDYKKLK